MPLACSMIALDSSPACKLSIMRRAVRYSAALLRAAPQ
jgi:hypothetical protein